MQSLQRLCQPPQLPQVLQFSKDLSTSSKLTDYLKACQLLLKENAYIVSKSMLILKRNSYFFKYLFVLLLLKFSNAAKVYEKRLNRVSDACRCLELMGDYAKALDLLCSKGFHSKALDVVDRYKVLKQEHLKLGSTKPKHIKPPG